MLTTTSLIDRSLQHLKDKFYFDFMQANENALSKAGLFCLSYVIPVLAVITGFMADEKYGKIAVAAGFLMIPVCIYLRYVAEKMLGYIDPLIEKSPSQISSQNIFDILALTFGIAGILALIGSIYVGWTTDEPDDVLAGLLLAFFCEYIMAILLTPEDSLNISVEKETSLAQELLGITSFIVKACYRLVPIVFGATIICGAILLFGIMCDDQIELDDLIAFAVYLSAAVLPLIAYVSFLTYYFVLDMSIAFFKIPEKLDGLIEKK